MQMHKGVFTKQNLESSIRHSDIVKINDLHYCRSFHTSEIEILGWTKEIWDKYHCKIISIRSHIDNENNKVVNITVKED